MRSKPVFEDVIVGMVTLFHLRGVGRFNSCSRETVVPK